MAAQAHRALVAGDSDGDHGAPGVITLGSVGPLRNHSHSADGNGGSARGNGSSGGFRPRGQTGNSRGSGDASEAPASQDSDGRSGTAAAAAAAGRGGDAETRPRAATATSLRSPIRPEDLDDIEAGRQGSEETTDSVRQGSSGPWYKRQSARMTQLIQELPARYIANERLRSGFQIKPITATFTSRRHEHMFLLDAFRSMWPLQLVVACLLIALRSFYLAESSARDLNSVAVTVLCIVQLVNLVLLMLLNVAASTVLRRIGKEHSSALAAETGPGPAEGEVVAPSGKTGWLGAPIPMQQQRQRQRHDTTAMEPQPVRVNNWRRLLVWYVASGAMDIHWCATLAFGIALIDLRDIITCSTNGNAVICTAYREGIFPVPPITSTMCYGFLTLLVSTKFLHIFVAVVLAYTTTALEMAFFYKGDKTSGQVWDIAEVSVLYIVAFLATMLLAYRSAQSSRRAFGSAIALEQRFVAYESAVNRWREAQTDMLSAREAEMRANVSRSVSEATIGYGSHQLRNPLHLLNTLCSDIAARTDLPPEVRADAQEAITAIERMTRVTDDLLAHQRLLTGRIQLILQPTDIRQLISRLALQFSRRAQQVLGPQTQIPLFVADDVPAIVWVDPTRVIQMLVNGLSNAVEHVDPMLVPPGQPPISIHISRVQAPEVTSTEVGSPTAVIVADEEATQSTRRLQLEHGGESKVEPATALSTSSGERIWYVHFEVRNAGKGLQGQDPRVLFAPFAPGLTYTTRRIRNTGLGLPIVRLLASLMRGRVGLFDEPPWTRFFVELPELQRTPSPRTLHRFRHPSDTRTPTPTSSVPRPTSSGVVRTRTPSIDSNLSHRSREGEPASARTTPPPAAVPAPSADVRYSQLGAEGLPETARVRVQEAKPATSQYTYSYTRTPSTITTRSGTTPSSAGMPSKSSSGTGMPATAATVAAATATAAPAPGVTAPQALQAAAQPAVEAGAITQVTVSQIIPQMPPPASPISAAIIAQRRARVTAPSRLRPATAAPAAPVPGQVTLPQPPPAPLPVEIRQAVAADRYAQDAESRERATGLRGVIFGRAAARTPAASPAAVTDRELELTRAHRPRVEAAGVYALSRTGEGGAVSSPVRPALELGELASLGSMRSLIAETVAPLVALPPSALMTERRQVSPIAEEQPLELAAEAEAEAAAAPSLPPGPLTPVSPQVSVVSEQPVTPIPAAEPREARSPAAAAAVPPAAAAAAAVAPAPAPTGPPPPPKLGLYILAADDERSIRAVNARLLKRLGCDFIIVTDGDEVQTALDAAAAAAADPSAPAVQQVLPSAVVSGPQLLRRKFDVLLLDIVMCRLNGDVVARRIRDSEREAQNAAAVAAESSGQVLPLHGGPRPMLLVAATGNASEADKLRYLSQGFDDVLAKPFTIDDMAECFARLGFSGAPEGGAAAAAGGAGTGAGTGEQAAATTSAEEDRAQKAPGAGLHVDV